jgi:hypothetical protein
VRHGILIIPQGLVIEGFEYTRQYRGHATRDCSLVGEDRRLTVVSGHREEECELPGWQTNGPNGTVSDDHQCLQKRGIRRLRGFYFFHISCAQSGSQAGGDMRNASSVEDLWSPSIFSTSHA